MLEGMDFNFLLESLKEALSSAVCITVHSLHKYKLILYMSSSRSLTGQYRRERDILLSSALQVTKCRVIEEVEVAPPQVMEVQLMILYTSSTILMFTSGKLRDRCPYIWP